MSFSPSPGCQDTKLIKGNPGQDETLRGTQKYLPEEKKKKKKTAIACAKACALYQHKMRCKQVRKQSWRRNQGKRQNNKEDMAEFLRRVTDKWPFAITAFV